MGVALTSSRERYLKNRISAQAAGQESIKVTLPPEVARLLRDKATAEGRPLAVTALAIIAEGLGIEAPITSLRRKAGPKPRPKERQEPEEHRPAGHEVADTATIDGVARQAEVPAPVEMPRAAAETALADMPSVSEPAPSPEPAPHEAPTATAAETPVAVPAITPAAPPADAASSTGGEPEEAGGAVPYVPPLPGSVADTAITDASVADTASHALPPWPSTSDMAVFDACRRVLVGGKFHTVTFDQVAAALGVPVSARIRRLVREWKTAKGNPRDLLRLPAARKGKGLAPASLDEWTADDLRQIARSVIASSGAEEKRLKALEPKSLHDRYLDNRLPPDEKEARRDAVRRHVRWATFPTSAWGAYVDTSGHPLAAILKKAGFVSRNESEIKAKGEGRRRRRRLRSPDFLWTDDPVVAHAVREHLDDRATWALERALRGLPTRDDDERASVSDGRLHCEAGDGTDAPPRWVVDARIRGLNGIRSDIIGAVLDAGWAWEPRRDVLAGTFEQAVALDLDWRISGTTVFDRHMDRGALLVWSSLVARENASPMPFARHDTGIVIGERVVAIPASLGPVTVEWAFGHNVWVLDKWVEKASLPVGIRAEADWFFCGTAGWPLRITLGDGRIVYACAPRGIAGHGLRPCALTEEEALLRAALENPHEAPLPAVAPSGWRKQIRVWVDTFCGDERGVRQQSSTAPTVEAATGKGEWRQVKDLQALPEGLLRVSSISGAAKVHLFRRDGYVRVVSPEEASRFAAMAKPYRAEFPDDGEKAAVA